MTEEKTDKGNTYEQSGNFGIGNMNGGEIKDAKIGGVFHEAPLNGNSISINGNNPIINNYTNQPPEKISPTLPSEDSNCEQKLNRLEGDLVKKHRYSCEYKGELVCTDLDFFRELEANQEPEIGIVLDITFGEFEEEFYQEKILGEIRKGYIRFGIKHGKLRLHIQNGSMPLKKREFTEDSQKYWIVRATGNEQTPTWEFEANNESKTLSGSRIGERLGSIDIFSDYCIINATFDVKPNRNDIEITSQCGLWDSETKPSRRETKIRAFFKKVLEPKLKDYLSKMELRYDPTVIS